MSTPTNSVLPLNMKNPVAHGKFGGFIDLDGVATCTTCKETKTNTHFMFYTNRVNPDTKHCLYTNKKCDECRRKYIVHKKQSEQDMKSLNIERPVPSIENPYKCDCCGKNIVTTKTIQLDHCHEKGIFRGWCCKECNISIGNLGDNIAGMMQVIKYLNRTEKVSKEVLKSMIEEMF
jgi:Recombination endonuclease VII